MFGVDILFQLLYIILIGGGLVLGFRVNRLFFLLPVAGIALIFFVNKIQKERENKKITSQIKEIWGKDHDNNRDFKYIRKLFDANSNDKELCIDDITWRDLDMDYVFKKVDHTMSYPGEQYLYYLLRHPVFDNDDLKRRYEIIESFRKNKSTALKFQTYLKKLGKEKTVDVIKYLKEGINIGSNPLSLLQILPIVLLLSPIIIYFAPPIGILLVILLLVANGMIYSNTKYKIYEEMMVFQSISKIFRCANEISKLGAENTLFESKNLNTLFNKLKNIFKNIGILEYMGNASSGGDQTGIISFLNMLFLIEVRSFYKSIDLVNKYKDKLLELYIEIGKIDSYIALASYKDSLKYYTEPKLYKVMPYHFNASDIYHPLLKKPVPNSLKVDNRGILLTGSNASGKSTFLKTIGINAIFAQTFYTVLANEYSSNFFNVMTSIGTLDNIIGGDSYFMVEAKSLKRIIDHLNGNVTVLCILDEIFRGTNTIERISAADEVLHYMTKRNCFVIAATHDIELTTLTSDTYDNYHFEEEVDDNDVKFNYLLQNGTSKSRNAIKILKLIGYPEEIYKNAMNRANEIS